MQGMKFVKNDVKSEEGRWGEGGNWNKIPAWVKGKNPECTS